MDCILCCLCANILSLIFSNGFFQPADESIIASGGEGAPGIGAPGAGTDVSEDSHEEHGFLANTDKEVRFHVLLIFCLNFKI